MNGSMLGRCNNCDRAGMHAGHQNHDIDNLPGIYVSARQQVTCCQGLKLPAWAGGIARLQQHRYPLRHVQPMTAHALLVVMSTPGHLASHFAQSSV